ncbi:hypothetical protein F4809DRAFT_212110 [Biscogniauxia mediterranea]|nr:hypothetical protein F4809DRAFT_212110 [Biscogniauxia mediterranea]
MKPYRIVDDFETVSSDLEIASKFPLFAVGTGLILGGSFAIYQIVTHSVMKLLQMKI